MDKQTADKLIIEYNKKLFGYALSKTSNILNAEELASKISLEVYTTLLKREKILNINAYIYRIAQNVYARYIDEAKRGMHLSLDEVILPAEKDFTDEIIQSETYRLLRREIAFLSKTQREIVILHYYDKLKLNEISKKLCLPLGTVKWHLYEAKNSLKEGLNLMRKVGNLGIKPIRFCNMGHNGNPGSMGDISDFFKRRLTQNIAYAAYHKAKTINEIAQELGVSPLFIEDEVLFLEEYGFMDRVQDGKYLTNMVIAETTKEISEKEHLIYIKYAKIICEKYIPLLLEACKTYNKNDIYVPDGDINLLLWSVITYACGYNLATNKTNDMYKYSVKRKDGGDYIAFAEIFKDFEVSYNKSLYSACGDMIRKSNKYPIIAWKLNTYYDNRNNEWRNNNTTEFEYLYEFITDRIKKEESQIEKFQQLYEKGYVVNENGKDKVNIIIVKDDCKKWMFDNDFTNTLPGITDELLEISKKLDDEMLEIWKNQYPPHMQKLCKTWLGNCLCNNEIRTRVLEHLLQKGILKLPTEVQKSGLTTIMFCDILPK